MTTGTDEECIFCRFSMSTSLHGVKHITCGSNSLRRTFWIVALMFMLVALVYIIMIQVLKFTSYPFYTVSTLQQAQEMAFPSVTICNNNQFRKSYLANDSAAQLAIRLMYDHGPKAPRVNLSDPSLWSAETNCDPRAFFSEAAHQLTKMFRYCSWQAKRIECEKYLTPIQTDFGYCYTFNSKEFIERKGRFNAAYPGAQGGLKVIMDIEEHEYFYGMESSAGIKVLVHEPDDVPSVRYHGFVVGAGTKALAATSLTTVRCLPPPYLAMGSQECLDTDAPGFKSPLSFYPTYDIRACYRECSANYTIRECGCQDSLNNAANVSYCSLRQMIKCYKPTTARNKRNSKLFAACRCKRQCRWNQYDVSLSSARYPLALDIEQYMENRNISREYILRNYLELTVFFEQLWFTKIDQVAAYTAVDIVANLGGQLGIFLGASFLTLTEVVECIVGVVCMRFGRRKKVPVEDWSEDRDTSGCR